MNRIFDFLSKSSLINKLLRDEHNYIETRKKEIERVIQNRRGRGKKEMKWDGKGGGH